MDLGRGLGHLTYSTLVHPFDDWPQLWDSLNQEPAGGEEARLAERAVRRLHPDVAPDGSGALEQESGAREA